MPDTLHTATDEPEYAGFWRRLLASLIDTLLAVMIATPILLFFFGPTIFDEELASLEPRINLLVNSLLPLAATVCFWVLLKGTPGKLLMGCHVVNARTGENLGIGRSVVRYIAYFISSIIVCLGFFWIAIDRRKQGWHDKIAGTVVIRIHSSLPPSRR